MLENPKLTSIRGLAVSDDSKRLYFADYSLGVFGVDLAAGKAFDLDYSGDKLVLGGIDGLYSYDGTLVVIENGMSPKRVMRLQLGKDGHSIERAMPLDVANSAFGLPTYGTIDGDGLYFVANSQKNDYDTYGVPKDLAKLEAVRVFRSNLRFAWSEGGIDTRIGAKGMPAKAAPHTGVFDNVEGGAQSTQPAEGAKSSGG
jgi:DNA-binding beta-propeller fold protein YncE